MNAVTIRTVANSLIIGAVIGFIGGAWTVQATHPSKAVLSGTNKDDLTVNAILASLSRIRAQCADIEHQASKPPVAEARVRRTAMLLNP